MLFKELFKGLSWGIGFSISATACFVAYLMYMHALVMADYKQDLDQVNSNMYLNFVKSIEPEVLSVSSEGYTATINARHKRLSPLSSETGYMLKYTIFDGTKYLGVCSKPLTLEYTEESHSYYQSKCAVPALSVGVPENLNVKISITHGNA